VNGKRVDAGRIGRADGNKEVVLPVALQTGTHTVTWRVTSADGHPARGGFSFFVGSPSTISAVAAPIDAGTSTFVTWGYGVARFLWIGAFVAIVGMTAMRRWVWTPAVRAAGLAAAPAAAAFRRRISRALPGAWAVLVTAGGLTLVFQAATVSGFSLLSSARPAVLGELLGTAFGRYWLAQIGLAAAIGLPVSALASSRPLLGVRPRGWIAVLAVLAAGLCLATALNGHARTLAGASFMVPSLALHLLAVAVWVGGLGALVVLGRMGWRQVGAGDRPRLLRELVARFSRLAIVAVAVIAATGVLTSIGAFASLSDLWDVTYGKVVGAKVALLAAAVVLAASHRRRPEAAAAFERSSAAELVAVAGAVALGAALVAIVPGTSLALAEKGPVNQERRAGDYTVQLFIDPTRVGDNEVHVTFVNARGLAAAEVATAEVTLGPKAAPLPPLEMRLISPGHFVGDATLPAPGTYQLAIAAAGAITTFDFRLYARSP